MRNDIYLRGIFSDDHKENKNKIEKGRGRQRIRWDLEANGIEQKVK